MKKTLLIIASLIAVGGITLAATKAVSANEKGEYPPIVQKLAERFNLDEEEVKSFFAQEKSTRHEEHRGVAEEKISASVADGTLTQEQADYLLDQMAQMENLSPEERKEAMKTHHEQMKAWAEGEGIDLGSIMGHPGGGPGFGHGAKRGQRKGK